MRRALWLCTTQVKHHERNPANIDNALSCQQHTCNVSATHNTETNLKCSPYNVTVCATRGRFSDAKPQMFGSMRLARKLCDTISVEICRCRFRIEMVLAARSICARNLLPH